MTAYEVRTTVPVYVTVTVDDDGAATVSRVIVDDAAIAPTLSIALDRKGELSDENGLIVKPSDTDYPAIAAAYDDSLWPSWDMGA